MHTKSTWSPRPIDRPLENVRRLVKACIQCGTCSGSCPNEFAMDVTPRQLWRMVLMGCDDAVFASRTFTLCSACYQCTLRCPRGLPLTQAMAELKQIAARRGLAVYRRSTLFYASFLESVRRHGRVREMEFMTLYFARMRNPLLPLSFGTLGLRLLAKGKVHVQVPTRGSGKLKALFDKVAEIDRRPTD
jgi:heterodisulfide reductase subunit C